MTTMGNSENTFRDFDSTWEDDDDHEDTTEVKLQGLVIFMIYI